MGDKRYDRDYFDRWYHNTDTRVMSPGALRRRVAMVVALTEHFLHRPIENVLDVGCGEGSWRAPLKKLRPKIRYLGLDTSPYVIERFGRRRNIYPLSLGQLAEQRFDTPFDLIICANVLHYVDASELRRGLSGFRELLYGMAYLETYVRGDPVRGDHHDFKARPASWYRKVFAEAGMVACGPQAWLHEDLAAKLSALEVAGPLPPA